LDAEKTGRSPRTGLVLSSRRCTRRLLRLRRCRILAFTRNPFLLVVMMRCYFIQHRRNSKGFRVFQKNSKQKCDTFAYLRASAKHFHNRDRSVAIGCHALTGNADLSDNSPGWAVTKYDSGGCPPAIDSGECVGIATSVLAQIHARQCHGRDRPLVAGGPKLLHQASERNEAGTTRPIHSRQSHARPQRLTAYETKIPTTPNSLCIRKT